MSAEPKSCQHIDCGHVDTSQKSWSDAEFMSPYDWENVQDAVLHCLGLVDDRHCHTCYENGLTLRDCEEAIARGDACFVCGAAWQSIPHQRERELLHAETCAYLRVTEENR